MTPEEIDRVLAHDAARVRASPGFSAAVMEAVKREASVPPPIPFPWTRAAPGIAAVALALAAPWFALAPTAETPVQTPVLERGVGIAAWIGDALAALDPRWALIWAVVAVLTVVPVLAPFWLVSAARDS